MGIGDWAQSPMHFYQIKLYNKNNLLLSSPFLPDNSYFFFMNILISYLKGGLTVSISS